MNYESFFSEPVKIVKLNGIEYYYRDNLFLNVEYTQFIFNVKKNIKLIIDTDPVQEGFNGYLVSIGNELLKESIKIKTTPLKVSIYENEKTTDAIVLENCDIILDKYDVLCRKNKEYAPSSIYKVSNIYYNEEYDTRCKKTFITVVMINPTPYYTQPISLYKLLQNMVKNNKKLFSK